MSASLIDSAAGQIEQLAADDVVDQPLLDCAESRIWVQAGHTLTVRDGSRLRSRGCAAAVVARRADRGAGGGDPGGPADRLSADVYRLAQLYLCYQDAPELLWVAVDRGLRAALDADDPLAIASGA